MGTGDVDVRDQIVAFKRKVAPNREALKRAYSEVRDHVSRAADNILSDVPPAARSCQSSSIGPYGAARSRKMSGGRFAAAAVW